MANHGPGAGPVVPWDVEQHKILGLTIWQPWAWAISRGLKLVENRKWRPPAVVIGKRIAIHAGLQVDHQGAVDCQRTLGLHFRDQLDRLIGADGELELNSMPKGAITAVARLVRVVERADQLAPAQRPWFVGPYGFVLDDVVAIEPVPCKGKQKLWGLDRDALWRTRHQYLTARAARKAS